MLINDFPNYDISEDGIIRNIINGKVLKPQLDYKGYYRIRLCNGTRKTFSIHRLIALHFISNPDNLLCVDHINGIRHDNRIENLRWCSTQQNSMNREGKGFHLAGKKTKKYLSQIQVSNKNIYLGVYLTQEEASQAYKTACIKYKGVFARE